MEELISSSGDITFDGKNYAAGGLATDVLLEEGFGATISVFASPSRVMQSQNGNWRGGSCKIYFVPASSKDPSIFDLSAAILMLDGSIDDSQFQDTSGRVTVSVAHANFDGEYTPRHLISAVSHHIVASGTAIVWDGSQHVLEGVEPVTLQESIEPLTGVVRGRPTASDLQSFVPPAADKYRSPGAEGAFLSLPYGRKSIPGRVVTKGLLSGDYVVLVEWGLGEIQSVDRTYINDVGTPTGVFVRHYRGKLNQIADTWLVAALTAYSDTMILTEPAGSLGVAYSVFLIPPGVLGSVPTSFKADGHWKLVEDPRNPSIGDPHASNAGFSIEFDGVDGSTSATDDSAAGYPISFYGDAEIQSSQLVIDATSDSVQVDTAGLNLSDHPFTLEIKATPDNLSTTTYLLNKGNASIEGFVIYKQASVLKLSMSSNGTSFDIVSGETLHTLTDTSEFYLVPERTEDDWLVVYLNGDEVYRRYTPETIFETAQYWTIGGRAASAASSWRGKIRVARLTIGKARYHVPHDATATPFADEGSYTSTKVYSDNSALCFADVASSEIYGLGATVSGLSDAADWCDELALNGVERCRLSLSLSAPRKTTEYLDYLASYADCIWYNEGSDIVLKADRAIGVDNPSGQNIALDSDFDDGSDWTLGVGWSVSGGLAVCDGTQVSLSAVEQVLATEPGTQFVLSFDIDSVTAGSVSLEFEGLEVIPGKSATGNYRALVTASGSTATFKAIASSTPFEGSIGNLRCERLYYLTTAVVEGSVALKGLSDKDSPTRINARITDPSDTSGTWGELAIQYSLPGVDQAEAALRPTSLSLPGVFREEEGNNKAHSKLLRSVNRTECSWVSKDDGIVHLKGNVVHLKLPYMGIDEKFWLESINVTSAGRYAIKSTRYDIEHFPSEQLEPANAGTVPVDLIVLQSGTTTPAGWEAYTAADGKFIVGAGGEHAPGDTGGSATHVGFSGNTTGSDGHDGPMQKMNVLQPASDATLNSELEYTFQGLPLEHDHPYGTGTITPDLFRRENILMKKTGTPSAKFPSTAMVFGLPGISIPNAGRIVSAAGRLLRGASANANLGQANQFISLASGSVDFAHKHYIVQLVTNRIAALGVVTEVHSPLEGGHVHPHAFNFQLVRSVKKNTVALYAATDDFSVAPGHIGFWPNSIATIPAGFVLCDGTNGTQDLVNRMIEIAGLGGENIESGDNKISIDAYGSVVTHDHDNDTSVQQGRKTIALDHKDHVPHTHRVTRSDDWIPEWLALAPIMYNP